MKLAVVSDGCTDFSVIGQIVPKLSSPIQANIQITKLSTLLFLY
jgi:hypothetical protein